MNVTLTQHSVIVGERVVQITDWHEPHIVKNLSSYPIGSCNQIQETSFFHA